MPDVALAGICPVNVNEALAPLGIVVVVQVTVPPAPADGVEQFSGGPLFCSNETKVISPGSRSLSATFWAGSGPAFDRTIMNETSLFGGEEDGPFFVMVMSACCKPGVVTEAALVLFSSF